MTTHSQNPSDRTREFDDGRREAHRTAFNLGRNSGAEIVTRPAFRGSHATVSDLEPLAGMHAARNLELGTRSVIHDYIRAAREAGHRWHDIGTALHLTPNASAEQAGETLAEAAYTYATGGRDANGAGYYGRSFVWSCPACDQAISDRGPYNGPADNEYGHASDCRRLEASMAAWDALWDADWEAGK